MSTRSPSKSSCRGTPPPCRLGREGTRRYIHAQVCKGCCDATRRVIVDRPRSMPTHALARPGSSAGHAKDYDDADAPSSRRRCCREAAAQVDHPRQRPAARRCIRAQRTSRSQHIDKLENSAVMCHGSKKNHASFFFFFFFIIEAIEAIEATRLPARNPRTQLL